MHIADSLALTPWVNKCCFGRLCVHVRQSKQTRKNIERKQRGGGVEWENMCSMASMLATHTLTIFQPQKLSHFMQHTFLALFIKKRNKLQQGCSQRDGGTCMRARASDFLNSSGSFALTFALSLVIRFGASTNSLLIEQIFFNSPLNF